MTLSAAPKISLPSGIRTSQPQGSVYINWSNPICRGLEIALKSNGAYYAVDGISKGLFTNVSFAAKTSSIGIGTQGLVYPQYGLTRTISASTDISFFSVLVNTGSWSAQDRFNVRAGATNATRILTAATGWTIEITTTAGTTTLVTNNTDKIANIFVSHRLSSGLLTACINGKFYTTSQAAGASFVAAISGTQVIPFSPVICYLHGLFNRALSDAEIKSLSNNPWQIFAPAKSLLPATLAAHETVTPRQSYMLGTTPASPATSAIVGVPRRVCTSQPQGSVGIDWSNPITIGLVSIVNTPSRPTSTANTYSATRRNPHSGAVRTGFGATYGVSTSSIVRSNFTGAMNTFTLCIMFVCYGYGGGSLSRLLHKGAAATGPLQIMVRNISAGAISILATNSSGVNTHNYDIGRKVVNDGRPHILVVTSNTSGAWIDGVFIPYVPPVGGTFTASPTDTTADAYTVGNRSDLTRSFDGYISEIPIWNRALSDAEIKSLSANPWQIFAPASNPIWGPSI